MFSFPVPPHPVVIFDESLKSKATFVGPYEIGDPMKLTCDAFGGKGTHSYIIVAKAFISTNTMGGGNIFAAFPFDT